MTMLKGLTGIPKRIDGLEEWLAEQSIDVKKEQAHTREGTKERVYWHYGYLVALKDVLALISRARPVRTRCCELGVPAGKECVDCPKRGTH